MPEGVERGGEDLRPDRRAVARFLDVDEASPMEETRIGRRKPAVGGRVLPYGFWRRFAEIENVVAIKIAPFNRYATLDVVRAVTEGMAERTPNRRAS